MTDQDRAPSPWGEPAGNSYRSAVADAGTPAVRTAPSTWPAAKTATATRRDAAAPPRPRWPRKRRPMLVERTILVRIIPRTGWWVRLRAFVALTVIAIAFGLAGAAVLSVIVWGVATAIHHAAGN